MAKLKSNFFSFTTKMADQRIKLDINVHCALIYSVKRQHIN